MAGVHWTTAHMFHGSIALFLLPCEIVLAPLQLPRFDTIFRQVYNSPELNNVVWFSVLGNPGLNGLPYPTNTAKPDSFWLQTGWSRNLVRLVRRVNGGSPCLPGVSRPSCLCIEASKR